MDIYLDTRWHLPHITVDGGNEVDGAVFLKLKCLNETISCPHCGATLERIKQTEIVLIRDLPVFGKPVYFQVPRRQFHGLLCQRFWSERLEFVAWRPHHTQRYEPAIYEQVKQSSLEAVSRAEGIGVATVRALFNEQAANSIKKSSACQAV